MQEAPSLLHERLELLANMAGAPPQRFSDAQPRLFTAFSSPASAQGDRCPSQQDVPERDSPFDFDRVDGLGNQVSGMVT